VPQRYSAKSSSPVFVQNHYYPEQDFVYTKTCFNQVFYFMKKENIKKIVFVLVALLLIPLSIVFAEETEIITDTPPSLVSEETQTENPAPEESLEAQDSEQIENLEAENDIPPTIESLTINDGDHSFTIENISLLEEGSLIISDTEGKTEPVNARSVLATIYKLDETNDSFEISELIYYASFNAFYLKCIRLNGEEKCDNWLYKIDGESPSLGMDNHILSGGEEIEIYFSSFFSEPEQKEEENENSSIVDNSSSSGSSPGLPILALFAGVLGLALYLGKRYFLHKT